MLALVLLPGGCKFVGVDYEQPEVALPDQWQQKVEELSLIHI